MERLTKRNQDGSVGINAFRYYNYQDFQKLTTRLADYEDAEEQGLLLKLPVAIGSEVWKIVNQRDNFTDIPYKIVIIAHFRLDMLKEIGKTVFLTKEEAKQALKQMGE